MEQPLSIDAVSPLRTFIFEGSPPDKETLAELIRNGRMIIEIIQEIDKKRLKSASHEATERYGTLTKFVTRDTVTDDFNSRIPGDNALGISKNAAFRVAGTHLSSEMYDARRHRTRRRRI